MTLFRYLSVLLRPMKSDAILMDALQIPTVISRLAGGSMPSMVHHYEVSAWLRIEVYAPVGDELSEETGRLICLPVTDDAFGLQLAFTLPHTDGTDAILLLHIHPQFLAQWPASLLHNEQAFRFDHAAEHELRIDTPIKSILAHFVSNKKIQDFSTAMVYMEHAIQLLRRAVEQLNVHFAPCVVPACRFLAYESEREKIHKACAILDAHYDERLTIKDLARKVAMNECYLKKGFKTLTGSTIHEYIAARRIASARQMLQVEGRPVTEVAASLGYSSISHFSTAFKKATGLKPCELLH
jgi:AraC-like DNA-binding protein